MQPKTTIHRRKEGKLMKFNKFMLTATAIMSALAVTTAPVFAANVTDKGYSYYCQNGNWHTTRSYEKTNTSKVYVKPSKSPSRRTDVQTYCNVGGRPTNKTTAGTVTLKNGQAYAITNGVYERGDKVSGHVMTWLRMRGTSGKGTVSGVWSPDWTGRGNVIIV